MEEEYPQELFNEEYSPEYIEELKTKFDLLKVEEETFKIEDNKKYYLGGIKYLFSLSNRLNADDKVSFWESINLSDFISQINNVNTLTKLLSKTIFNLDVDVEVLHLIVKDYFKKITNIHKLK